MLNKTTCVKITSITYWYQSQNKTENLKKNKQTIQATLFFHNIK